MPVVTVFGGTGFLGRRIVARLAKEGLTVRVAVRHSDRVDADSALAGAGRTIPVRAVVLEEETVLSAIAGVESVVNTVSTYVEKGGATYTAVHVHGASNVAKACARHGVSRLLHISGIRRRSRIAVRLHPRARSRGTRGAEGVSRRDAASSKRHVRPRRCFPSRLAAVARSTPIVPLIGRGRTRMQPIHVSDVAEAVYLSLHNPAAAGRTYELGGPASYTIWDIINMILDHMGRKRRFFAVPSALAYPVAHLLERLPNPPLIVAQLDLLSGDNIPAAEMPGIEDFGIVPQKLEDAIAELGSLHDRRLSARQPRS